jgi:alpha-L-rhamnosidase
MITFALLLFLFSSACGALAQLSALTINGLTSPLSLDANGTVRFSWLLSAGSVQLTYRISVSSTYPSAGIFWDSGTVSSNASSLIAYAGAAPLSADADFSVSVWVGVQGVGLLSASSAFSTAPAAAALRGAGAWLGFADTLRASVWLSRAPVLRARLHVSGVGCYVALVNGARVSAPLAPGFGHAPSARALFDSYDVRALIAAGGGGGGGGESVVALRLGSCKWGAFGQYCGAGSPARCNAGWALLTVDQGGGNVTRLATAPGGAWAAANTSVLYEHLWNGELFDARLEQAGWAAPGFANASAWARAQAADAAALVGPLTPSQNPRVVDDGAITPASVRAVAGGAAFVFDLGANIAGVCALDLAPPAGEARAPAGAAVSLLHAELLHANGSVYNHYLPPGGTHQPNGLNQPQMNYTYVVSGSASAAPERAPGPHFSYFGFRYIELRGWPYAAPPTVSALACRFTHSELQPAGALNFADAPALDALQAAVLRTHLSNYVTLPTDCPQREKRGWTGDAQ